MAYYKFTVYGLYDGKVKKEEPYTTSVAPPDENVTAKWVWNHVNWVAMPLDWEYVPAMYVPTPLPTQEPAVE